MRKKTTTGTLYGIGVGPGDPELITLKALNILRRADIVFAASSTKNSHSLALSIAAGFLKEDVPVELLGFPMTRNEKELKAAWKDNARKVTGVLRQGKDAVFITLGDPVTYSTFGYLMQTVRETDPDVPIEIIPGITSYHAGAAAAGRVLAEAEESFTVVSGAMGAEQLRQVIDHTDNVVMLKVYRNYGEIIETVRRLDLAAKSVLISRCGLEGEEIVDNLEKRPDITPNYLSMLLIKKKHGK